jgi:23S rRNA (cytidine1920-2'-O)/16S rRNA (cytidine1409-2'-O)-methyltransferase
MMQVQKERLDLLLVQRGLAASRQQAQRLIMAGRVTVKDRVLDKPGTFVPADAPVVVDGGQPYVSRGGHKLAAALDAFRLDVAGWIAADVGASTGGFTDCLLQRGAIKVYAIDVGYGQLAWKLRQDARVIARERTNARYLERLPELVDLVTVDVSFISLKLILPRVVGGLGLAPSESSGSAASGWLKPTGQIVTLIKPQFEAGRFQVGKGGVVRDPEVHRAVLIEITGWAHSRGLGLAGLIRSPLTGPAGNVEFLAHWLPGQPASVDVTSLIESCTAARDRDSHA